MPDDVTAARRDRLAECIASVLDECGRAEASEAREILLGDDDGSDGFDGRDERVRVALAKVFAPGMSMVVHHEPPPPRIIPVALPCPRCGFEEGAR